jgi:hypothetical protein
MQAMAFLLATWMRRSVHINQSAFYFPSLFSDFFCSAFTIAWTWRSYVWANRLSTLRAMSMTLLGEFPPALLDKVLSLRIVSVKNEAKLVWPETKLPKLPMAVDLPSSLDLKLQHDVVLIFNVCAASVIASNEAFLIISGSPDMVGAISPHGCVASSKAYFSPQLQRAPEKISLRERLSCVKLKPNDSIVSDISCMGALGGERERVLRELRLVTRGVTLLSGDGERERPFTLRPMRCESFSTESMRTTMLCVGRSDLGGGTEWRRWTMCSSDPSRRSAGWSTSLRSGDNDPAELNLATSMSGRALRLGARSMLLVWMLNPS